MGGGPTRCKATNELTFLIEGSSHSYQRALHCLADLRCSSEAIRDHWFFPKRAM
jgi:hypothetical protein